MIKAINEVRAGRPRNVIGARCLPGEDIFVAADCRSTKALLEQESELMM
jgi:hypothetical protein